MRVTGQSLGAAVVAIALAAAPGARGIAREAGIVHASHLALWLGAGCAFVAMLVSALRLRKEPEPA